MPSRQLIWPLEEGLRAVSLTVWPVAGPALNLELGFSKGKSLRGGGRGGCVRPLGGGLLPATEAG